MRQMADLVRGMDAFTALNVLKFNTAKLPEDFRKTSWIGHRQLRAKKRERADEGTLLLKRSRLTTPYDENVSAPAPVRILHPQAQQPRNINFRRQKQIIQNGTKKQIRSV